MIGIDICEYNEKYFRLKSFEFEVLLTSFILYVELCCSQERIFNCKIFIFFLSIKC